MGEKWVGMERLFGKFSKDLLHNTKASMGLITANRVLILKQVTLIFDIYTGKYIYKNTYVCLI
jgi:hypothetical protein